MKKIIIAIDGHSSCGKSTLAKELGHELNYIYISSGAMYRAVALYFLNNNVDIKNEQEVERALKNIKIDFKIIDSETITFLNGKNVEEAIKTMYVSNFVSPVATISIVRKAMVLQQQILGKNKGIVMDGRDIGTVVFKDATLKLFLTADVDVRSNRRFQEIKAKDKNATLESVKSNLTKRDHIDSTRADSPLKKAHDAIIIDNTNLTKSEQLAMTLALAKERIRNSC